MADFGLARILSLDAAHEADNSYGTVTHMPPEVLNGAPFQRPADVWSFGVLLWVRLKIYSKNGLILPLASLKSPQGWSE